MTTNEQSLREALEPCPFCGGADDADEPRLQDHDLRGLEITFRFVECPGCGACGPRCATKRQAIKAWNTRQALSRPAMSEEDAAELLASTASPTDTEGNTVAGFANWFEGMPADHPVTVTVADIRRWAQEAGRQWTSALSAAASPGSDMVAEVIAALEDLLVLCEHDDFRNGVLDQTGSIDEGEVCAGEYISRAEAALTSLKASALPSGDGWQDTKHKWNDGRPGYGYQCIYCGTIASYVNGHSNSLDDCPQRTGTSK